MGFRQESQWKRDANALRGGPFRLLHRTVVTRLSAWPSGVDLSAPCFLGPQRPRGFSRCAMHTTTRQLQVSGLITLVIRALTESQPSLRESSLRVRPVTRTVTCSPYCPALLVCCCESSVKAERLTRRAVGLSSLRFHLGQLDSVSASNRVGRAHSLTW